MYFFNHFSFVQDVAPHIIAAIKMNSFGCTLLILPFLIQLPQLCLRPPSTANTKNFPVGYLLGDFAVDVNNPCELVGFADYYFIATVNEVMETSYRHAVVIETEDGGEKALSTPYTDYSVDVLRDIKGTLPENEPILLTKAGGVSQDGKTVVLNDGSDLPPPAVHIGIMACILFLQGIHAVFFLFPTKNIKLKSGQTSAITAEEKT